MYCNYFLSFCSLSFLLIVSLNEQNFNNFNVAFLLIILLTVFFVSCLRNLRISPHPEDIYPLFPQSFILPFTFIYETFGTIYRIWFKVGIKILFFPYMESQLTQHYLNYCTLLLPWL